MCKRKDAAIENTMVQNNPHDSNKKDFDEYCSVCSGELYYGMEYYSFYDYLICEECKYGFLDEFATKKVAGE